MRKLLVATTFLASTLTLTSSVYAANGAISSSRSASVQIVEPLALAVVSDLSFGKIQRPTTGTQTAIMSTAGVLSGTATSLGGTITKGSYTITGDATETIGITITDTANITGMTLAFTPTYNGTSFTSGATGLVAPTTSGKALVIGATLSIDSTKVTTSGVKAPGYSITVAYQ